VGLALGLAWKALASLACLWGDILAGKLSVLVHWESPRTMLPAILGVRRQDRRGLVSRRGPLTDFTVRSHDLDAPTRLMSRGRREEAEDSPGGRSVVGFDGARRTGAQQLRSSLGSPIGRSLGRKRSVSLSLSLALGPLLLEPRPPRTRIREPRGRAEPELLSHSLSLYRRPSALRATLFVARRPRRTPRESARPRAPGYRTSARRGWRREGLGAFTHAELRPFCGNCLKGRVGNWNDFGRVALDREVRSPRIGHRVPTRPSPAHRSDKGEKGPEGAG
jgi:hypothetical protein